MHIGGVPIGGGAPLVWISGLNVLETSDAAVACAEALRALAERHGLPLVFKASFDKANRTHGDAYRGPGIDAGLEMLARVKHETGLPLMTDVHEPAQAAAAAEVVDCLQIPAFLVRQTDLIAASAATGRPLNLKRGQFIAPAEMRYAVDKAAALGATEVLVTERGSSFGFNDLVVDMRGLVTLAEFAPICFDATHAAQRPGAAGGASGGDRRMVAPLARAAVATGVDALFVETHPNPDAAPCDAACQLGFDAFEALAVEVSAIRAALGG
ncbi:MAG: 3-deoxy-8-phosphooctulonate synthase [Deltaproteobacteria bacterium]|nr:3-deoxy-8-phosphooctulonate synthase [Deltaproteobacteria bacterium]